MMITKIDNLEIGNKLKHIFITGYDNNNTSNFVIGLFRKLRNQSPDVQIKPPVCFEIEVFKPLHLEEVFDPKARKWKRKIIFFNNPENNLHPCKQKTIIQDVINLYPKAQIVCNTNSAHILKSVDNSFIYDIEKKTVNTDFSELSVENIDKYYFGITTTKEVAEYENKLSRFKNLVEKYCKSGLSKEEKRETAKLEMLLDEMIPYISDATLAEFKKSQEKLFTPTQKQELIETEIGKLEVVLNKTLPYISDKLLLNFKEIQVQLYE